MLWFKAAQRFNNSLTFDLKNAKNAFFIQYYSASSSQRISFSSIALCSSPSSLLKRIMSSGERLGLSNFLVISFFYFLPARFNISFPFFGFYPFFFRGFACFSCNTGLLFLQSPFYQFIYFFNRFFFIG